MFKKLVVSLLLGCSCTAWSAVVFHSTHALVVDEGTGQVLLDKNPGSAAPIASVTKLMTVMVVLDLGQDLDEVLRIESADIDSRERISTGIPVGSTLSRRRLIELALLASDNHAAAAIARNFTGGRDAFDAAMQQKIAQLTLRNTTIEEPTGLSSRNQASAEDLVQVLRAAEAYPLITASTTQAEDAVLVNGRLRNFHNTNGLVGRPGWDILLSKTGTTFAAGRCLVMRMQSAGRTVFVVLMGARAKAARALDALNVQRWLTGDEPPVRQAHLAHGAKTRRSA